MSGRAYDLFVLFAPTLLGLVAVFALWGRVQRRFKGPLATACKALSLASPAWMAWLLLALHGSQRDAAIPDIVFWLGVPAILLASSWPILLSDLGRQPKMLAFAAYLFVCMPTIMVSSLAFTCAMDAHGCRWTDAPRPSPASS